MAHPVPDRRIKASSRRAGHTTSLECLPSPVGIKERYDQGGSTRDAVIGGVAGTARIITGAALIIVVVFAGFARGQLVMFQQMGFGVAVALLLDATVVRTVILPSTLTLLDHRSWYLPRWLEWLPRLQVEGRS